MEIIITRNSGQPIYEQITSQIRAMILSGELKADDPLPSMRELAKSIRVGVVTVQKAYEDLQRDGFIDSEVGRGSFVAANDKRFLLEQRSKLVESHIQQAAEAARSNGLSLTEAVELFTAFYKGEES